jgi:hypothetical protein
VTPSRQSRQSRRNKTKDQETMSDVQLASEERERKDLKKKQQKKIENGERVFA